MFVDLTQPQGESILINLATVTRIWGAKEGGCGIAFAVVETRPDEGHRLRTQMIIVKESYKAVRSLIVKNGMLMVAA